MKLDKDIFFTGETKSYSKKNKRTKSFNVSSESKENDIRVYDFMQ